MSIDNLLERELNRSLNWIAGQRWFGEKHRTLQSVAVEWCSQTSDGNEPILFAIIRCNFADGGHSRYFVPVIIPHEDGMRDALTEDDYRRWVFDGFREGRTIEANGVTWRWTRTSRDEADIHGVRAANSVLVRREQSNSSVIYDDRLIAKVFRKLEPGPNPDVEIGAMFAASPVDVHTPRLVGTIRFEQGEESTVVAILQQFVHNRGDGWSWLLDRLEHNPAATLDAVRLLGQRTAEMHLALASNADDPAFSPDPVTSADVQDIRQRIERELGETVDGLKEAGAIGDDDAGRLHEALLRKVSSLDTLAGTVKIRIHGDYHLGQVLRTVEDDFSIIDFEGEPSRPMSERRRKWPALRDVAGMVRSLDYAAQTVRRAHPERGDLNSWLDGATSAFLEGYLPVVSRSQATLVPAHRAAFDAALAVLSLEKALYETRYELGNRPDWLPIPLGALHRIAAT